MSLLPEVFTYLGFTVLTRNSDESYSLAAESPAWFQQIYPTVNFPVSQTSLVNTIPFLGNFIEEAEALWSKSELKSIKSGTWIETDSRGIEYPLEASALSTSENHVLLLKLVREEYAEEQKFFQRARENLLLEEQLKRYHEMLKLRSENLMESNKELEVMRVKLAHDFKGILGVIIGNVEMALDDELEADNPARYSLEQVLKAGHRARELAKQILELSRRSEQDRVQVRLADIVDEAVSLLKSSSPSSITINHSSTAKIDSVFADATQIFQVLIDLSTNAVDSMREDGGVISFSLSNVMLNDQMASVHQGISPGLYCRLLVKDTGTGIQPEVMDKIFEPYFTTKKKGKGTGMGLAVVNSIMIGLGGSVTAESTVGAGSAVTLLFPVVQAETDKPSNS